MIGSVSDEKYDNSTFVLLVEKIRGYYCLDFGDCRICKVLRAEGGQNLKINIQCVLPNVAFFATGNGSFMYNI